MPRPAHTMHRKRFGSPKAGRRSLQGDALNARQQIAHARCVRDGVLHRLARDQWVRIHGTPRVTVLAGGARARAIWDEWLTLSALTGSVFEGNFDRAIRDAVACATADPVQPIGVIAAREVIAAWRHDRHDRYAAMVDEGITEVPELDRPREPSARKTPVPAVNLDARSAAEATLYEALEATPATRGRFQLNESLSVRFGSRAAEVDLLSRNDRIAIEIDGIHHFADPDCYRSDRRKDLLMQTQGLLVIRLLAEDVMRDVRGAVNVVCQALAYRLETRR
jgi:very-short-patch-repair endonuclease